MKIKNNENDVYYLKNFRKYELHFQKIDENDEPNMFSFIFSISSENEHKTVKHNRP